MVAVVRATLPLGSRFLVRSSVKFLSFPFKSQSFVECRRGGGGRRAVAHKKRSWHHPRQKYPDPPAAASVVAVPGPAPSAAHYPHLLERAQAGDGRSRGPGNWEVPR